MKLLFFAAIIFICNVSYSSPKAYDYDEEANYYKEKARKVQADKNERAAEAERLLKQGKWMRMVRYDCSTISCSDHGRCHTNDKTCVTMCYFTNTNGIVTYFCD